MEREIKVKGAEAWCFQRMSKTIFMQSFVLSAITGAGKHTLKGAATLMINMFIRKSSINHAF